MACECGGACSCATTLQAALDAARACVSCLGTGSYCTEVKIITRTWDGGEVGLGTATDVTVTLDPRPKVTGDSPRARGDEGGKVARGDRYIEGVSLTYTEADLLDEGLAAGVERYYLLNDKPYALASEPICKGTSWKFRVSRKAGRP